MNVLTAPVRFYRERLTFPPTRLEALTPGGLFVLLEASTAALLFGRIYEQWPTGLGVSSTALTVLAVLSILTARVLVFWMGVGAILAWNAIYAPTPSGSRTLIVLSLLACWPLVLWGILAFGAVLVCFEPPRIVIGPAGNVRAALDAYSEDIALTPFLLTFNLVTAFFWLWVVALQSCTLYVASGVSARATVWIAIFAGGVLVVAPWAWQRLG